LNKSTRVPYICLKNSSLVEIMENSTRLIDPYLEMLSYTGLRILKQNGNKYFSEFLDLQ